MKIRPTEKAKSYLQMQGVPAGLIRPMDFNLDELLQPVDVVIAEKEVVISEQKQLDSFNKLCKNPVNKPFVFVINSKFYFQQARQLATILFWSYLEDALNNNEQYDGQLPVWVVATNEFKNPLFDLRDQGLMKNPLMIVVDSLYSDAPANKLDKVHDWLAVFCDRPIVLLMHSDNPFDFCIQKLGCRPNMIMNIAKGSKSKVNVI